MKLLVQQTDTVFTKIIDRKQKIATDLTGKFPVTSNRGNNHLFVLYDYDSNCIRIRPMKSRADSKFIRFFTDLHGHLLARGLKPEYMRLYNEASPDFQIELKVKNIDVQLAPPRNVSPQCSGTGNQHIKDHFIAVLCSTDPDLPIQNWDRLVEQVEITLNLLLPSRLNPKLSSYAQLNGTFDYNRTPMPPPGTRTLVHEKPHNRGT